MTVLFCAIFPCLRLLPTMNDAAALQQGERGYQRNQDEGLGP